MRLIDADALVKQLHPEYIATRKLIEQGETHLDSLAEGYTEVHDLIRRAPTVDAELVKHGHWILAKPRHNGRNATYRCSCCGGLRSSYYNDVQNWEFCPCGAKMMKVKK